MAATGLGCSVEFQPTLPLRERLIECDELQKLSVVSTHAPLAGSDFPQLSIVNNMYQFQPTLPLRGATIS